MRTFAFRLHPGQDLKRELIAFAGRHALAAPVVLTCVGSLTRVSLRFAHAAEPTVRTGFFEIVSLVGCVDPPRGHLHLSVADEAGVVAGGHLMDGCEIYTTAEVVIGDLPGVRFRRELDPTYGYRELVVEPIGRPESGIPSHPAGSPAGGCTRSRMSDGSSAHDAE